MGSTDAACQPSIESIGLLALLPIRNSRNIDWVPRACPGLGEDFSYLPGIQCGTDSHDMYVFQVACFRYKSL
jgi:hypothetical protein